MGQSSLVRRLLFSRILSPARWVRRELISLRDRFLRAVRLFFWNRLVFSPWAGKRMRMFLLRRRKGFQVGGESFFSDRARISLRARVNVGKRVFVNEELRVFSDGGLISINDDCTLACEVCFITTTHQLGNSYRRAGTGLEKEIVVGSGVWIGHGVTILPGVTIGSGCVVAAGSIIPENSVLEPNSLYAGVPAKKKRDLTQ
jgi:maltose O-acetyltransferase